MRMAVQSAEQPIRPKIETGADGARAKNYLSGSTKIINLVLFFKKEEVGLLKIG